MLEENEEVPSWMNDYNMFDDDSQLRLIEENKKIIENSRVKIEDAKAALERNNRYKSVLYTSGDQLVSVVFEILQDMIGCDLSSFIDIKKEDFLFEIGDKVFIGEIKGISTNVKSANISQLDVHIQTYLDNHEDKTLDDIVALLIINHQRNKPLAQREDVQIDQINIACRNKSLILETITLLKMFEKYLKKELTREKCIHLLEETQGILKLNDKVS